MDHGTEDRHYLTLIPDEIQAIHLSDIGETNTDLVRESPTEENETLSSLDERVKPFPKILPSGRRKEHGGGGVDVNTGYQDLIDRPKAEDGDGYIHASNHSSESLETELRNTPDIRRLPRKPKDINTVTGESNALPNSPVGTGVNISEEEEENVYDYPDLEYTSGKVSYINNPKFTTIAEHRNKLAENIGNRTNIAVVEPITQYVLNLIDSW